MDWTDALREGEQLPGGSLLRERLARRADWQIWQTDSGSALAVSKELLDTWLDASLLEPGVFLPLPGGAFAAETDGTGFISSAEAGPFPKTLSQTEGVARAFALSRSGLGGQARLRHALYLSSIPHLLPVGAGADREDDPYTLGRWLADGVNLPFTDEERMSRYAPALTPSLYRELLALLGWRAEAPERLKDYEASRDLPLRAPVLPRTAPERDGPFELAGRPALTKFFREQVLDIIDHEEAYRRMGIGFPGPTLLIGPPGCGKTYAVQRLAEYLGWPVFEVNSSSIASMYIHETGRLIARLFEQAAENAPSVVVIDEMEAYLSARGGEGYGGIAHTEEMAEFLRALPLLPQKRVLLFGMTNLPGRIDEAILRKGRFDHVIRVEMATREEMAAVLRAQLKDIPVGRDVDYDAIGGLLAGRPISDAVYAAREAGRLAVVNGRERIDGELLRRACASLSAGGAADRRPMGFR